MAKKFRVFPVDGYSYETTYREYINSADWKFRADQFKAAKNHKCEECGMSSDDYWAGISRHQIELHVHHKHYRTLGREKQTDVRVLCRPCHRLEHPKWR